MNRINFEPIGKVYVTPMQKKERRIGQLEGLIKISLMLNVVLGTLLVILIYSGGLK